jgi:hypothetical protein
MLDHTFGINGYRVLGWPPDRRLVATGKVRFDLALADRSVVHKLFRVDLSSIAAVPVPRHRQRRAAHCSKAQNPSR